MARTIPAPRPTKPEPAESSADPGTPARRGRHRMGRVPSLPLSLRSRGFRAAALFAAALLAPAALGSTSPSPGDSPSGLTVVEVAFHADPTAAGATGLAEPRLVLRAPRQLRLRPRMPGESRRPSLDVRVSARLENLEEAENPEDYYCLEEVWDWDDDTESVYEPDCDPYEPGADIETYFFNSHRFSLPGTYRVYLRLQRSGETVIAGNISVRIAN